MIVSAVRATAATVENAAPLVSQIAALGEPLYRKLEPTGYSNVGEDWMSSAGLMGRMNFAMDLVQNQVDGVRVDPARLSVVPDAAARQVLFTGASGPTLEAIGKVLSADTGGDAAPASATLVTGMLLGSPDFQRSRGLLSPMARRRVSRRLVAPHPGSRRRVACRPPMPRPILPRRIPATLDTQRKDGLR
jgi:hypothetical protein